MVEYEECIKNCVNELIEIVKLNDNEMEFDKIFDNAIYPVNEELINDFTDKQNFDEEEFILFLIKRSDNILKYTWDGKILLVK
jgi:hypothetical protein